VYIIQSGLTRRVEHFTMHSSATASTVANRSRNRGDIRGQTRIRS
jgi:hypothetical protein